VEWFKVPADPPALPVGAGEAVASFRPAEGFLRYLTFQFWVWLALIDVLIMGLWAVAAFVWPVAGAVLLLPALAVAIVPDVLAYIAIHLRYDSTWYVLSDRSLRIRRGIWVIHETTITYENIQNVTVNQGPLQRWFGIADVRVDTAGGGAHAGQAAARAASGHQGLIEGVANAAEIRELILGRLRGSQTAGLGDERAERFPTAAPAWGVEHLAALREIRAAARRLAELDGENQRLA
jgi:membrane protein YdbS with pleckstrin-like domain